MTVSECKKCCDRKYILVAQKWRACDCLLELRKKSIYSKCGIPDFFVSYSWGDFLKDYSKMSNIVRLLKKMVDKVASGHKIKVICIKGESQSGKQALSYLLLKEFITINLTARFISIDDMIQMEFDKERRAELNAIYEKIDVVCLRMGTAMEHTYIRYVLEKFINSRKNNNKCSIITTRLDIESNAGLYGKDVAKILCDGRRAFNIVMR